MNPHIRQGLRLLRPRGALDLLRRRVDKVRRRLARLDERVFTFDPPPDVEPRGDVLVAYIADAFALKRGGEVVPEERVPRSHTHWWESLQIVETFLALGYRVDAISWQNTGFRPAKPYAAALDVRILLERWREHLPAGCVKILHAETAHWSWHNPAQRKRLEALESRRGPGVAPNKMIEENRALDAADIVTLIGEGAEWTKASYADAGKPIYPIPISTPLTWPRLERRHGEARRRFVWFGSGGLVHKGLDRVLEAFAAMPELELTVVGPIDRERDFERTYWGELHGTPNIRLHGWIDVASPAFPELMARHGAVVFPSCSEGQNGGVITCMHAGLVPIVSRETGVPVTPERGVLLEDSEIETIRAEVRAFAERDPDELQAMSDAARAYAREHHTRERFAEVFRAAIEDILGLGVEGG